ncbi:MAG: hypothetical protein J6Q74_00090, partial [Clostridia bacterium]|nr:hypothetical protein [Clostridia bacterium]
MNKRRIQKAIALVLALALMLSAFTVNMFVSAEAEPEVWNGQISDTAPVDSDSDGWIEINNGAELAYVIKNGGGEGNQYKLTADIYLNAKDAANWQTGAPKFLDKTPNSWYTNTGNDAASEFAGGTIDGDGHVIYGMYFEGYPESYASKLDGAALIPRLAVGATVTIKNLGIDNAYINHTNSASAFIGVARTGTNIIFENCYVGENVTLTAYNAAAFRANAEYNRNATPDVVSSTILTNCYSLATIAEQGGSYGLVGTISDAKGQLSFTNCYNAKGALGYGGNIGYYAVATNCYATAKSQNKSGLHQLNSGVTDTLTANDMQGEAFAAQLGDAYVATESYPILKAFLPKCNHTYDNDCDADCNLCGEEREVGHNFVDNICTVCGAKNVWDGEISTAAPVDSDSDGWIEINNGAELAYIIKNGGGAGNKYIITNDIYLNNITTDFWTNGAPEGVTLNPWFDNTSATDFNGEIDGNGKIVYGLYYANDSNRATKHYFASGLIPRIAQDSQVTIKNLGINNAYIKHPNAAAAFLGSMVTASSGAVPSVNIENCYAGANVTLNSNYAGVFVANTGNQPASITVKNSYSLATMDAATKGLLAYIGSNKPQKAELVNCYNGNGPIRDIANPGYTVSTTNCYETVESPKSGATAYWLSAVLVSAENMTGPNALTVMPLGDAYAATNSYPVLKVFLAKCNHTYDNDCDEDCNLCGEEREAGHNFVDNICTVCGAKDVWNGQVSDTAPVDSDSDGWIEINNGAELAYIIKNGGGAGNKYILTTDIYLNDITTDFWTNGAPEGVKLNSWFEASQAGDFNGTINGDGHVVYGLYYNASLATGTADGTGLIPRVNAGSVVTIENLGIDNAYIKHTKNASAFVGVAYKSGRLVIDKCYVGQNVTIE